MSNKQLECTVEDEGRGYEEREILIVDYTFKPGYPGKISGPPEDCYPGEPSSIEDVECKWADTGVALTDNEYDSYEESIYETICAAEQEVTRD